MCVTRRNRHVWDIFIYSLETNSLLRLCSLYNEENVVAYVHQPRQNVSYIKNVKKKKKELLVPPSGLK